MTRRAEHLHRGMPSTEAGEATDPQVLAHRLGELARTLEGEHDVLLTLQAIVHAAVGTIPGAEHASISAVRGRRRVETRAATDDLPVAVDRAQYETREGPCLDTLYDQETVRLEDLATEQRWPAFTAQARELGVGSMLAVQLYVNGAELGALNLINGRPHGFDDDSEQVALLVAAHAAVAMAGAQQQAQLRIGMARRDVIGQAKGILMERHAISGEQAFRFLARVSQDTNRKLHDLAQEVVAGAGHGEPAAPDATTTDPMTPTSPG